MCFRSQACDSPPVMRTVYQRLKSSVVLQREMVDGIGWGWVEPDLSVVLPLRSHENTSKAVAGLYAIVCGTYRNLSLDLPVPMRLADGRKILPGGREHVIEPNLFFTKMIYRTVSKTPRELVPQEI